MHDILNEQKKKLYENIVKSARINEYLIYTTSKIVYRDERTYLCTWNENPNEMRVFYTGIHTHTHMYCVWYRNARVIFIFPFFVRLFIQFLHYFSSFAIRYEPSFIYLPYLYRIQHTILVQMQKTILIRFLCI